MSINKIKKKSLRDKRPESKCQNYYSVVTREVHFENHKVLYSYIDIYEYISVFSSFSAINFYVTVINSINHEMMSLS